MVCWNLHCFEHLKPKNKPNQTNKMYETVTWFHHLLWKTIDPAPKHKKIVVFSRIGKSWKYLSEEIRSQYPIYKISTDEWLFWVRLFEEWPCEKRCNHTKIQSNKNLLLFVFHQTYPNQALQQCKPPPPPSDDPILLSPASVLPSKCSKISVYFLFEFLICFTNDLFH